MMLEAADDREVSPDTIRGIVREAANALAESSARDRRDGIGDPVPDEVQVPDAHHLHQQEFQ